MSCKGDNRRLDDRVLGAIRILPGKDAGVLGRALGLPRNAVEKSCNRLAAAGLVTHHPSRLSAGGPVLQVWTPVPAGQGVGTPAPPVARPEHRGDRFVFDDDDDFDGEV